MWRLLRKNGEFVCGTISWSKDLHGSDNVFEILVKIEYGFIGMVFMERSLNYHNVIRRLTITSLNKPNLSTSYIFRFRLCLQNCTITIPIPTVCFHPDALI